MPLNKNKLQYNLQLRYKLQYKKLQFKLLAYEMKQFKLVGNSKVQKILIAQKNCNYFQVNCSHPWVSQSGLEPTELDGIIYYFWY